MCKFLLGKVDIVDEIFISLNGRIKSKKRKLRINLVGKYYYKYMFLRG